MWALLALAAALEPRLHGPPVLAALTDVDAQHRELEQQFHALSDDEADEAPEPRNYLQTVLAQRRAPLVSLLQTDEAQEALKAQTLDGALSGKRDDEQKKRIIDLVAINEELKEKALAFEDAYNLYSGQMSNLKSNFHQQLEELNMWRMDSSKLWKQTKFDMQRKFEDYQGAESTILDKVFGELFTTYGAIGSLFRYEAEKYQQTKHKLKDNQLALKAMDEHYTKYVDKSVSDAEENLQKTCDMLGVKTEQVRDFYQKTIDNGYNSLKKNMDGKKAQVNQDNKFMNQVMFTGGAQEHMTPKPAPATDTSEKAFWNGAKWLQLEDKGGPLGTAAKTFHALSAELAKRSAIGDEIAQRAAGGTLLELGDLESTVSNKGFDMPWMSRRRGKAGIVPKPIDIPPLKPLLDDTREKAEQVESATVEKTGQIERSLEKVERKEQDRDKEFQVTMSEVERLADEDSTKRINHLDFTWNGMLTKHERALKLLETDLFAAITQVDTESRQAYKLANAGTTKIKKARLRDLGELKRELKQVARKMDATLISVKSRVSEAQVDIAKANNEMTGTSLDAQSSAKQVAKTQEQAMASRFGALNSEIDAARTADITAVQNARLKLSNEVNEDSANGKQSMDHLKKEAERLDQKHDEMFKQSEQWIESFNDQLVNLGNKIREFGRSSLKDAKQMSFNLEQTRQKNVDALMDQQNALARKATTAKQAIDQAKISMLDDQTKLLDATGSGLRRAIDKDELATSSEETTAKRTMKQVANAVQRGSQRHATALATAKEQVGALQDQLRPAESAVKSSEAAVDKLAQDAQTKREDIEQLFHTNLEDKFKSAMALQQAQISVDSKNAQRELGGAAAEFAAAADKAQLGVKGVTQGIASALGEFEAKDKDAKTAIERVSVKEGKVKKQIDGDYRDLTRSLTTDEEADQQMKSDLDEYVQASSHQLAAYAQDVLGKVSGAAVSEFHGDLAAREAKIDTIVENTQHTFQQKEQLIQAVNFEIVQKLESLEKQSSLTTQQLDTVAAQEAQTRAAADLAEQHAARAASEEAQLAEESTEAADDARVSRTEQFKKQVRAQGHFASKELDAAIDQVAQDSEAEIQAIRDQEHLTEREKQAKIDKVEHAAREAVTRMANTEAAAGRSLTAFELVATKWGDNLGAHLQDLEDALQAEEVQRAHRLAASKQDLAQMSERFHSSVQDVRAALEKAHADGKIVLTPAELQELHQMEARAHADLQVHKQEAAKEQRVAELLEQRAQRSGEMSEQELANLEAKLMLLTGTVSGGVSSLRHRERDMDSAREEALAAQNHFAAASVGQALQAVSKMAEFLVAGTRVSGLKQQALDRQQAKLAEVLKSPLANMQEELGMKTEQLEKNEHKMEGYANQAKQWKTTYESKVATSEHNAQEALDSAQAAYAKMPGEVQDQMMSVEMASQKAMRDGMESIDKEAAFDAGKARADLGKIANDNAAYSDELEHRAQQSANLAKDEVERIKFEEYRRFKTLDANDDALAAEIMKLKSKSEGMIKDAQAMSGRVAAAVNANVFAAEQKRAAAGSQLATLNRRATAMAGNDPEVSAASIAQISSSLSASDVSDAALEKLAAELEQHNAQEAAATAKAEQVNDDVRKLVT